MFRYHADETFSVSVAFDIPRRQDLTVYSLSLDLRVHPSPAIISEAQVQELCCMVGTSLVLFFFLLRV